MESCDPVSVQTNDADDQSSNSLSVGESPNVKLRRDLARLRLGLLRSDDLPGLATQMLVVGYDSPRLVDLAGLDLGSFDPRDAADLWDQALTELDMDMPGAQQALLTVACPIARGVVEGRLDPIVGARQIVEIGQGDSDVHHLVADFVYPVDVSGYYEFEKDVGWWTRRKGLRSTKRHALEACRSLLERCDAVRLADG